ncbi:MAG: hypothetical protein QXH24_02845 [Candidatus Bathyarchaeia archaeon]
MSLVIAMRMLAVLTLLLAVSFAQQHGLYNIDNCLLTVYRDGIVHVYLEASVDELEPSIELPLFSSPDKINNTIALDENNEPLYYEYGENNTIIIYSLGASQVKLEYDTMGLTSMEYGLWTLKFSASFDTVVRLPENSEIIYINAAPEKIKSINGRIELTLPPGDWEISYEVRIAVPQQRPPNYLAYYAIIGTCVACAIVLSAIYARRRWSSRGLSGEEAEIVKYIRERGGRVLEAELREKFPHIPRTSMWRLVRRLEKRSIVQVRKVGLQNVVELK